MDIIEKIRATILKYEMISAGETVLAGLSGGPDSVSLLVMLNRLKESLGMDLHASYIDHGLRPDEISSEIGFCGDLCRTLKIPFHVRSIDVKSFVRRTGLNKQEAARELRYGSLLETARTINAQKIAIGHTADDQAETVIMRLLRGSGRLGLSGIPPVRQNIIRPLIEISRREIEVFLASEGTKYVTDSSNMKDQYMRNKIRQSVMPVLREIEPDAVNTIARASDIFREEDSFLDKLAMEYLPELTAERRPGSVELFLSDLGKMDRALARRVLRCAMASLKRLRGMSLLHIEEILELAKSGRSGDRITLPGGTTAIRSYSTLVITTGKPAALGEVYVMERSCEVILKEALMVLRCSPSVVSGNPDERDPDGGRLKAVFDSEKLAFPLTVRSRRPGDYFYPSGFGKKKKLQDYFVDCKVPRDRRDCVPLLISEREIVWVIGYRADERFVIDKNSAKALKFEVSPLK